MFHMDDVKQRRAIRFIALWTIGFLLVVCLALIVGSKANAACVSSSTDPTCPTASQFVSKWKSGFYHKRHGFKASRLFAAPRRTRNLFEAKYAHMYNNASPKKKKAMMAFSVWAANHISKTSRNGDLCAMLGPPSLDCMERWNWAYIVQNTRCLGINTYPSLLDPGVCTYAAPQYGLSWHEVRTGLAIGACTVATGAAITMAVGSDGTGAPAAAAIATGVGCGVTFWERMSP